MTQPTRISSNDLHTITRTPTLALTPEQLEEHRRFAEEAHLRQRADDIRRELAGTIRVATPPRYRNAEVDVHDLAQACDDVTKGRADGILLTGPTGVGKTHAAYAALAKLAETIEWQRTPRIIAVSVPDMLARCRPGTPEIHQHNTFGEGTSIDPIDWYAKAGLLLLDDLGAEKPSEWTAEVLYRIIDHRYNHMLPTIVVSNLPPADLAKQIGDRLASRLTQMCRTVVIKGEDRRRVR